MRLTIENEIFRSNNSTATWKMAVEFLIFFGVAVEFLSQKLWYGPIWYGSFHMGQIILYVQRIYLWIKFCFIATHVSTKFFSILFRGFNPIFMPNTKIISNECANYF